jgi:ribosomal protein L37E
MSYRCGISEGLQSIGLIPCEPHIICDACGATRSVYRNSKPQCGPAVWFLDNKKAPGGWSREYTEIDDRRIDYCPKCTELRKEKK